MRASATRDYMTIVVESAAGMTVPEDHDEQDL